MIDKNAIQQKILWSLLLTEEEKQDLLKKMDHFSEKQLESLETALDHAEKNEGRGFDELGKIDPEIVQKIKKMTQNAENQMFTEAEKEETPEEKEKAEELLEKL